MLVNILRISQSPQFDHIVLASGRTAQIVYLELIGEDDGLEAVLMRQLYICVQFVTAKGGYKR